MTLLMKLRGSHGAALSTVPEYESAITDRGPHEKAPAPKAAAAPERLSEISLEAAEARGLELDQEITRRRERVAAARRTYDAAREAHKAAVVAGEHPDYMQVSGAKSACEREEDELAGFEEAKVAHRPKLLGAQIDALVAEQRQHLAAAAEWQQKSNVLGAAAREAENRWNEAVREVGRISEQASACEQKANELRRELAKL